MKYGWINAALIQRLAVEERDDGMYEIVAYFFNSPAISVEHHILEAEAQDRIRYILARLERWDVA